MLKELLIARTTLGITAVAMILAVSPPSPRIAGSIFQGSPVGAETLDLGPVGEIAGMVLLVGLHQVGGRDARVDLGAFGVAVAQQFFDSQD